MNYSSNKEKLQALITCLPEQKLAEVLDFVEFIAQKTQELTDDEILKAAEQSGSFKFLEGDSEDIYSLKDGKPIHQ